MWVGKFAFSPLAAQASREAQQHELTIGFRGGNSPKPVHTSTRLGVWGDVGFHEGDWEQCNFTSTVGVYTKLIL